MLFTNIQLDYFNATMARFIERLAIEGTEESGLDAKRESWKSGEETKPEMDISRRQPTPVSRGSSGRLVLDNGSEL